MSVLTLVIFQAPLGGRGAKACFTTKPGITSILKLVVFNWSDFHHSLMIHYNDLFFILNQMAPLPPPWPPIPPSSPPQLEMAQKVTFLHFSFLSSLLYFYITQLYNCTLVQFDPLGPQRPPRIHLTIFVTTQFNLTLLNST